MGSASQFITFMAQSNGAHNGNSTKLSWPIDAPVCMCASVDGPYRTVRPMARTQSANVMFRWHLAAGNLVLVFLAAALES